MAILCERAYLQPDDAAFTYIDYEQDYNGVAKSLTWSQLYRRTLMLRASSNVTGRRATGDWGGRCAAIAVPDSHTEKLVVIIETKKQGDSPEEIADNLDAIRSEVAGQFARLDA